MKHITEEKLHEPTLQEILGDPITKRVMASDGVQASFVEELAVQASRALKGIGRTR